MASTVAKSAAQEQDLPTIVVVQGSFQTPQVYEQLVNGLSEMGYLVIHPQLPSCSNTDSPDFPKVSLLDDAATIRGELLRQIEDDGKLVIVVMHSYGGLVGSEAITADLHFTKRRAKNLPGGVVHLFFYTAFLLNEGQSVLSAFGESPNNDVKVSMRTMFSLKGTSKGRPTHTLLARRSFLHSAWREGALQRPPSN